MGAVTDARYRKIRNERFSVLLGVWLGSLPPAGWSGSVAELEAALDRANDKTRNSTFVPSSSALSKAVLGALGVIEAAGWRVEFRRTAKARTIAFTRDAPAKGE
jgi:hypothetical protein